MGDTHPDPCLTEANPFITAELLEARRRQRLIARGVPDFVIERYRPILDTRRATPSREDAPAVEASVRDLIDEILAGEPELGKLLEQSLEAITASTAIDVIRGSIRFHEVDVDLSTLETASRARVSTFPPNLTPSVVRFLELTRLADALANDGFSDSRLADVHKVFGD